MNTDTQSVGNFEKLAQPYASGRREFDSGVFDFLINQTGSLIGKEILDIGCGTGIATRQLSSYGANMTGCDISPGMIAEANRNNDTIEYAVAPTNELPYKNGVFDIATAFSSFHWFTDTESIKEIKRVLKDTGYFAVINKNDVSGIRKDVNKFFQKYRQSKGAKEDYDPATILEDSGFVDVSKDVIKGAEVYTYDEAIEYLSSIAPWNMVPEQEKQQVLLGIEAYCREILEKQGMLKRELETVVVLGHKA